MKTIKITKEDQYVWLLITDKAKEVYLSGLFELYILYNDDSEALVESFSQLSEALENGLDIGISVGFIDLFEHYDLIPDNIKSILDKYSETYSYTDCASMLAEIESQGYTFDYGLDAQPYNLRPNGHL